MKRSALLCAFGAAAAAAVLFLAIQASLLVAQSPSPAPSPSVAPPPPPGASRDEVWGRLKRNGMITHSMESSADGARAAPYDTQLNNDARRKIFIRKSLAGDADMLRGLVIRQYDQNWGITNRFPIARYQALAPSAQGGDAQVAAQDLVTDYMGSYLRYLDLSSQQTEQTYAAQRQAYFDFIKNHLRHRFATGLVGTMVLPAAQGGTALAVGDLFNAARQNARDPDFVVPDPARVRRSGEGFQFAGDGFARTFTFRDWSVEFLFQKKSSWPELDRTVIEAAGSTTAARRYKDGGPDFWGWWLSPATYPTGNPSGVVDAYASFDDAKWAAVKGSGLYDVATALDNRTLDLMDASHYSALWGPTDNEYYFDPGHQRADLNPVNDLWFQYLCHVLVRSKGKVQVSGGDTFDCGPYYHSDLFYVEMYATEKTVPETLATARQVYGERYAYAYAPPVADGARVIDPPDEARYLFAQPGTPDGLATPVAHYPGSQLDFNSSLPETFRDDANVFYKTGADSQSLIRFPPPGTQVPSTMPPEARTPQGFQAFLDQYYTNFAVYFPPQTVDGSTRGPWLVNLADPPERGLAHPYAPDRIVPGTNPAVSWKSVVYRPTRFTGELEAAVGYLYTQSRGAVIASYGTGSAPAGYRYAMKGAIWSGHPVFEVPTRPTGYRLEKGALPIPVTYQTMHGDVTAGSQTQRVVAAADVQLADLGSVGANQTQAQDILPKMRDNYAYAAVTISAGCCGTVTQKLIDKKVGVAFQPRANLKLTLTDPQGKTNTGGQASTETLGLWHDASLSTGVSPLPYDPMSVGSRMPAGYAYGSYQNNFATLAYNSPPAGAPADLLTDAQGRNVLETQLTYFAGQNYDIRIAAEPATGPSVVEMDPQGNPTPGQQYVYYCAQELSAQVFQVNGAQRTRIKEVNFLPEPLTTGPLAGLTPEPPAGTVSMAFPQEGDYEFQVRFRDCNGASRDVTSRVRVVKKGFQPQLVGEERERK
jgi:hypothetical protein